MRKAYIMVLTLACVVLPSPGIASPVVPLRNQIDRARPRVEEQDPYGFTTEFERWVGPWWCWLVECQ